jgi:hypothetical protein
MPALAQLFAQVADFLAAPPKLFSISQLNPD